MNKKQKRMLARILVAAVLMIGLLFVPVEGWLRFGLYMIPYLVIGYDILKKAGKGILRRQVFDENFLMAVATVGAIVLAVTGEGDYTEAVAVMLFYQVGELFQSIAVGKSRRNISQLMDIRPDSANLESDGELLEVDPDAVEIGSVIVVRPGEKVPIDGIVIEGASNLDTVALTGESLPREVKTGEEIVSGCINLTGLLRIRTTKAFGESTVSKILELVENASSRKSRSEAFISKFARVYTPAVCYGALALALLPPLFRVLALGLSPAWGDWIYRALTFLVISCPCALVISIPLSFFAGIGGASNAGILIKGSNYLETLAKTRTVVMDKTGTLTEGVFDVTEIHAKGDWEPRLLEAAAHAESASSHPIARSICRAYGKKCDATRVKDLTEHSGNGVTATFDGVPIAVGNAKLMERWNIPWEEPEAAGTVIHIAMGNQYAGYLIISDRIKETSQAAIASLKRAGVRRTVMLTGDNRAVAEKVARELEIDRVYSNLLPEDKVKQVETLLSSETERGTLAFVGDGINDAPVLSRADVGIAMGAMGSDAAIEAADVVLMDDDPAKIAKAIRIARKCLSIVYQNIGFALGVKAVCLLLGALGIGGMWLAIFADVGVMVLAVLNAIRALFVKNC
ncbi:MAG: cadmium-translocating P-type ATPase [Clostridia bacterium]|nr:cadmium-translocating P-type ATPase [Clostridia bacterium]